MDGYFRFPCPACGKRLKATPEQVGRAARCSCGTALAIPTPAALSARDDQAVLLREPTGSRFAIPSLPRRPAVGWAAVAAVALVAVGIGVAVLARPAGPTTAAANSDPPHPEAQPEPLAPPPAVAPVSPIPLAAVDPEPRPTPASVAPLAVTEPAVDEQVARVPLPPAVPIAPVTANAILAASAVGAALPARPVVAPPPRAVATPKQNLQVKSYAPRAGDQRQVTEEMLEVVVVTANIMGKKDDKKESKWKSVSYVEEVLVPGTGTATPAKVKRRYDKYQTTFETFEKFELKDGNLKPFRRSEKHVLEGRTVLIELQQGKYTFTYQDGGVVADLALADLDREFNQRGRPIMSGSRYFLPTTQVTLGEAWKVDVLKAVGHDPKRGLDFDKSKASASGKLIRAYTKDGKHFGIFEAKLDAPITGIDDALKMTVKDGSTATAYTTANVCIDGTDPAGRVITRASFKTLMAADGVELSLNMETTATRTEVALPKAQPRQ